jgi:hypothetical protein
MVELAQAAKAAQKGLWITETGWPVEGEYSVSPAEQANLLKQVVQYARNNQAELDLKGLFWYNLRDIPESGAWADYCGLRNHEGDYRPSWVEFQNLTGAAAWPAPTVETKPATEVAEESVRLNASVNPNSRATTYQFEYGSTTSYGITVPSAGANAGEGMLAGSVSTAVGGLVAHRQYHYRVVAKNAAGTSYGQDHTFTTGLEWNLRNSNAAGSADVKLWFGLPGETRVTGDWDGNGTTTVGLYDQSTGVWRLRNANSPGAAEIEFQYGGPGLAPVTGDWDGDGTTTIGVYNQSTGAWALRNSNGAGSPNMEAQYGGPQWDPVTGDWDGDGNTTRGGVIH